MKLLLKDTQETRADWVREQLGADWQVQVWRSSEGQNAFAAALADADALVSMSWPADPPPAPRLALLQLPGTGTDLIAFDALPAQTSVCNVQEHGIGIAEYVVLGMLEWEVRLAQMDAQIRRGDWSMSAVRIGPLHGELYGKTAGFIGYGHIASETAKRLQAFGVRVIARTRTLGKADEWVDEIAGMDRLDELFEQSDYVVVTCPLNAKTRGLVDRRTFALMKPEAVLINVARGAVVEERALYEALSSRRIRGAVIDTWYRYPETDEVGFMPSSLPFHELDNIYMSAHASGWSGGLLDRRWVVMAENLRRFGAGQPLLNVQRAPGCDPAPI